MTSSIPSDPFASTFVQDGLNTNTRSFPQQTLADLDFQHLFQRIDFTWSAYGRQYLYACLLSSPDDATDHLQFDRVLESLSEEQMAVSAKLLENVPGPGASFVSGLTSQALPQKPGWFWIVPASAVLTMLTLVLLVVHSTNWLWLLFSTLIVLNFIIYYWNKRHVISYSTTVPEVERLANLADKLNEQHVFSAPQEITRAVQTIRHIHPFSRLISWDFQQRSGFVELAGLMVEIFKITFLIEPLCMFRILHLLERTRTSIQLLTDRVGELDSALSIAAFRDSLPCWTTPTRTGGEWDLKELFHPLLSTPEANDLHIPSGQSVVITGSNMSGKTTFLRTLGVNALLARTINTACAKQFQWPDSDLFSSITNQDDLSQGISFFQAELTRIQSIIGNIGQGSGKLVLIDELFKGTNSLERRIASRAVISYLSRYHTVIASTHDLELAGQLGDTFDIYHFSDVVLDGEIRYDYTLKSGMLKRTNAIRLMEKLGFPEEIIEQARSEMVRLS